MNIDKIVKECPKAFRECIKFFFGRLVMEGSVIEIGTIDGENVIFTIDKGTSGTFHYRRLYDYFDSVGVVISVYYDVDAGWCYDIDDCDRERWYESRQDVEFEAIPKAFEIREQQLKEV